MLISAIQKFTLLDFPEKTACIVFTAGCNFRCGYCHNPEFVLPEKIQKIKDSFITEEAFFNFLKTRKGLLDGVVITGGEPTIMKDLPEFIRKIKELDFLVKLDSNGNNPEALKNLIRENLLDYIAMDIKTDLEHYVRLVGKLAKPENIKESVEIIMKSEVPYEFRSTLVKEIHTPEILKNMANLIRGANMLYLQQFRSGETLDPVFGKYSAFSSNEMEEIADLFFTPAVSEVQIR